jgi:hypothetical protein
MLSLARADFCFEQSSKNTKVEKNLKGPQKTLTYGLLMVFCQGG